MPSRSVARMMTSPLRAFIGTPFTSMLTNSSLMRMRSRGLRLRGGDALSTVIDHVLEFMAEVLQEALHRPGRGIAQPADGMALDAVGDIQQQRQILAARLPLQHAVEGAGKPAGALAAG